MELFGVRVRIHPTFVWLLIFFAIFSGWGTVGLLLLVFAFVVAHELSHCLVARAHGIHVQDITLLPIGGVARMGAMPEDSATEFRIAIAGPALNLAIAAGLYMLAQLAGWPLLRKEWVAQGADMVRVESPTFLGLVISVNVVLGLFNLLPAFPMDGGRLLRAYLARRRGYVEATHAAARVGRWIAAGIAVWSIARVLRGDWGGFWSLLIAAFIYVSGKQEEFAVAARHRTRWLWQFFGYGQPGGPRQDGGFDLPPDDGPTGPRFGGKVVKTVGEVRPDPDAEAAEAFRRLARQMESDLKK